MENLKEKKMGKFKYYIQKKIILPMGNSSV